MQIYLVEATVVLDTTGATTIYRWSTGRGYNSPSGPGYYEPRLVQPLSLKRTAFGSGTTTGAVQAGYGEMVLANDDGALDGLRGLGFIGQKILVLLGDDADIYSSFITVFRGAMEQPTFTMRQVSVIVRDRLIELQNLKVSANVYGGTNVLPAGLDGVSSDLQGRVKPLVLGRVLNISPLFVNTSKLVYQVNDGLLSDIPNVYDKGVPLTRGTNYVSQQDMMNTAPSAGNFRTWLNGGCFRLGSQPAGQVTCDALQGNTAVTRTNLALYSEDPSNTLFYNQDGTTVTPNATVGFDYQLTAAKLVETTAASAAHRLWFDFTVSAGVTATLSVHVRPAERQFITISIFQSGGANTTYATFNCANPIITNGNASGAIGFIMQTGSLGTGVFLGASATVLTGGWLRFQISGSVPTLTTYRCSICLSTTGTPGVANPTYTGDGASGLYIDKIQFETGVSAASTYTGPTSASTASVTDPIAKSTAQILRMLALGPGRIATADISASDVTALDAANSTDVGVFLASGSLDTLGQVSAPTVQQVMDQVAVSIGAWYGFDRLGVLRMKRLDPPSGSPVVTFSRLSRTNAASSDAGDILTLERSESNDPHKGVPAYRITLSYAKNWTTQLDSNLGGDKTSAGDTVAGYGPSWTTISKLARRAFLAVEKRQLTVLDPLVQNMHRAAPELFFESLMLDPAAAQTEATRLLSLYGTQRDLLAVQVKILEDNISLLEIGTIVQVQLPRFGYDLGKLFVITGLQYDAANSVATLDLLG